MSEKCPIILGPLNKMLLIPFFLAFNQILDNIFVAFYPGKSSQILELYSMAIGYMLNIIIPHIKFFSIQTDKLTTTTITKDKKTCLSQRCFFHYSILMVLNTIHIILLFFPVLLLNNTSETGIANTLPFVSGAFTTESLDIILISLFSFFLLKYRYYIHNRISLVSFVILGVIIDLILENFQRTFNEKDVKNIVINLAEIVAAVINYCYQKYMIDVLYYNYYYITFALGLKLLIINSIAIPFFLSIENEKIAFFDSFDNIGLLISRYLIYMILQFFFGLLKILTLAYFTPNHLLICLNLSKFVTALIGIETQIKYLCIIPFAFQFFSLMVYLEILELNFCGLNKNTKRNIQKREKEEDIHLKNISRTSTTSEGREYIEGYYLYPKKSNIEPMVEEDTSEKIH